MTSEVVWSDRANRDLETLHDYIATDSPGQPRATWKGFDMYAVG